MQTNGEAVYGSKYFDIYGEGPTETATGHLSESKNKGFTQADIRFTTNNDVLYAAVLKTPTKDIHVRYLTDSKIKIKSIELLGSNAKIEFKQSAEGTTITLPKAVNLEYAWVFKIQQ
ncbi:MAG: alpha-L-fucosidase C-terminal domain-containing protein [Flavicella sp.]|nr:alpha-L-fucosidase C-terminal domain-containing protein [Flavicella sp.]